MYRELLLGCGHKKDKRIIAPGTPRTWQNMTSVDCNDACDPDVRANLDTVEWVATWQREPNRGAMYSWSDNTYDEVHAYEVLEHLGQQGNHYSFFAFMENVWNVLKPEGVFCATTPSRFSPWLWGDPGHRRAILPETLIFLDRAEYSRQLGRTAMSDYRKDWRGDFRILHSQDDKITHSFILQAIKPVRCE